jgi:hypothetical protein
MRGEKNSHGFRGCRAGWLPAQHRLDVVERLPILFTASHDDVHMLVTHQTIDADLDRFRDLGRMLGRKRVMELSALADTERASPSYLVPGEETTLRFP